MSDFKPLSDRCNIDRTQDFKQVRICDGEHHRSSDCEFSYYVHIEKYERIKQALATLLGKFPNPDVIEDLKADKGYGYRVYSIHLKDGELVELRKLIEP